MSESLVLETEYQDLEDASEVERQKSMAQLNTAKVIKGEIHNVLNVMRADARYSSPVRFSEELPSDEHPLLNSLKHLHEKVSRWETAEEPMDVVAYLTPFCSAVSGREISANITGAALFSIHKFLLYGFITQDTTPHAMEAMNLIAKSLLNCTFEESSSYGGSRLNTSTHSSTSTEAATFYDDEQVVLKLLNLAAMVVRTSLQQHKEMPLLDASQVVGLLSTCLHVSHRAKRASPLLKSAAADALGQIVLVVFHETPLPQARSTVLSQLSSLTNPQQYSDATCVTSLTLLNIALETMQQAPTQAEIHILQNDLCKHLLQLSTTHDLVILSLTLRVIFNLFQSIRNHLKVPLEVFITSVHLRILDPTHNDVTNEQREVALESLLEFCQEPALMQDLYLNYDCDVHCNNLYEMICATLSKMASPKDDAVPVNTLNRLALEGILHVIDSIAGRCQGTSALKCGRSESYLTDTESDTTETLDMDDGGVGDRWKTEEKLQERKRHKFILGEVAKEFNNQNKDWTKMGEDLGLFESPATPESVAKFLYTAPRLDKTEVGLYLSKGPAEEYPFQAEVRSSFCQLFDFKDVDFAEALRKFLSRFRLPGEAQCIDRLMEAFANELYQQQKNEPKHEDALELEETKEEPFFRNADAVFTLAFSTIILNTDLHNPNLRDDRRMTLEQFLRNNRGINDGKDFPEEFLSELYVQIKEKEIQVRKEVLDVIRQKILDDDGDILAKHWASVLSKSNEVAEPFFTPLETARRNDIQAGVHDRAMFVSISKSAIDSVSTIFVRSTDDALVVKSLKGFQQMAKICIYFELEETFNEILKILLGHGRDYIMSCIALEYSGSDGQQIMAAGPSSPGSKGEEEDPAAEVEGHVPVPAILLMPEGETGHLQSPDIMGSAAHRGLLSLDAGFSLIRQQPSKIRETWPTFIECLCALRDARALPDRVIFLDDFADSRGNLLPLSPFARQSQRRLDEYYRSLADRDENKRSEAGWFQFPSLFHANSDSKPSERTMTTQDETDGGDTIPETELSSFSQSLLAITKRAGLEDVVLMGPKSMPMAKQTIRALLDSIDEHPYFDDPVFEQHAVYSLELALLTLISNKDKVQELFPMFLPKFETILKESDEDTISSQASVNLPTPFLMERVAVTILRSCIHLYEYPEVRSDLNKALHLLLKLPTNFTRCVSDRMSCGMAIFVSQKFPLFESDEDWVFVGDMLDRLAHFGAGRGFVFDGVANAVESQMVPSSQKGDAKAELSYEGSVVLSRLLIRFIFGRFENDMSLVVPAMMCLENLYRHMVVMKRSDDSDSTSSSSEDDSAEEKIEDVPDKELWQNVAVAFYSVCRSEDPDVSRQGSDCFQRFVMSTDVQSLPAEKWISMLFLIVDKQPPVEAHETRINTFAILCKVLLMTLGLLSKQKSNWDDLNDVISQTADVADENLQEGRKGSVSPLFQSTLQAVTFLSNHLVSDEFDGDKEYGQWACDTLLAELEKVGAMGGTVYNVEATTRRVTNGNNPDVKRV